MVFQDVTLLSFGMFDRRLKIVDTKEFNGNKPPDRGEILWP